MSENLEIKCYKTPFGIGMLELKLNDGKHESELYKLGDDVEFLQALEIAVRSLRKQVEQQDTESDNDGETERHAGYTGMVVVKKGDDVFKEGHVIKVNNGAMFYKTGSPFKDFFIEILNEVQTFESFDEMKECFQSVGVELKELKEVD